MLSQDQQTVFEEFLVSVCQSIYKECSNLEERYYQAILFEELHHKFNEKYTIRLEENIPVFYKNRLVTTRRMDITLYNLDNSKVPVIIIELKCIKPGKPATIVQLSEYMGMTGCELGYTVNFTKNEYDYTTKYISNYKILDILESRNPIGYDLDKTIEIKKLMKND